MRSERLVGSVSDGALLQGGRKLLEEIEQGSDLI